MKKIIHLSDLHVLTKHYVELNICNDLILNGEEFVKNAPPGDTVIVITGDLSNCGAYYTEYIDNARGFVDGLKGKGYEVFVAPGNHDYSGYFGLNLSQDAATRFRNSFYGTRYDIFPKIDVVSSDGKKTAFIGLDSMEGYLFKAQGKFVGGWYACDMCVGLFGSKQLEILKTKLESDDRITSSDYRVMYFHHNPFYEEYGWNIADVNDLWDVIESTKTKIDALLFGHDHNFNGKNNGESVFDGYKSIPRCYDASSTTGHLVSKRSKTPVSQKRSMGLESKMPAKNPSHKKLPDVRYFDLSKSGVRLISL